MVEYWVAVVSAVVESLAAMQHPAVAAKLLLPAVVAKLHPAVVAKLNPAVVAKLNPAVAAVNRLARHPAAILAVAAVAAC